MNKKYSRLLIFLTPIYLPFLLVASPNWLKINGVSPCWPVIFLLPFSLRNDSWKAALAAIFLGFLCDSFTLGEVSYIPSLLFLALVWGRYDMRKKKNELIFNIGLMAIFGTAFVGFSIWLQKIFLYSELRNNWFHGWAIHLLISEVIITGLLAPLVSSWILIAYKKN